MRYKGMGAIVRDIGLRLDLALGYRIKIRYISVDKCVDEFGRSFGVEGTHFFIKLLTDYSDRSDRKQFLIDFYSNNLIKSFYNTVQSKVRDSTFEDKYFLPWEKNRVRDLSKFLGSHKIGPTPSIYLDNILDRLLGVYSSIKKYGISQNRFSRV